MRSSSAFACAFLLAGCLPTRTESVPCTTDVDCTSVRVGSTCDTRWHVCVCDGTSAFAGCAKTADGGTLELDDVAATVDADSPVDADECDESCQGPT